MLKSLVPLVALSALVVAKPAAAQQPGNLGGGFIEFLVTGNAGGARYAPAAPAQRAQGSYYASPQVLPRGRTAAAPAYATAPEAIPVAAPEPAPRDPWRGRSNDLAYAATPETTGFASRYEKQVVDYSGGESAGTVVIDTPNKFLYLVQGNGKAMRYGIGVGRPGFAWAGIKHVSRKAEWPGWTPPPEMRKRRPDLPRFMEGGVSNPLGARAMYLGSSLYRIHGTNEPSTIGQAVSSGCIRMRNQDVIDLYDRIRVGTKVIVI